MDEPRYVDNWDEPSSKRPKWMMPETDFQIRIMRVFGRKWFAKGEKSDLVKIEKAMMSLATGIVSVYPEEWVNNCINFYMRLRKEGQRPKLEGLIKYINNQDKKENFISNWQREHKTRLYDLSDDDNLNQELENYKPKKDGWETL